MEILSNDIQEEIKTSLRDLYSEAMEQAQRDFGITKEYLTFNEVMKYLSVSRNTLTLWIEKGLAVIQIEGKKYIAKSDLRTFMDKHKQ